jgi:hypothetical protein
MSDWQELRQRNQGNIVAVMSRLRPEEQLIFQQVLQFELENRHINSPQYKEPIKTIFEQNIRREFKKG